MLTTQQKIEAIREACIKVNPEIVELKFGCELSRKGNEDSRRHYKVIEDIGFASNAKKVWINSVPFGQIPLELNKDLIENGGEFKILGRPIRLADVLLAIERKTGNYFVGPNGMLMDGNGISTWNLRADDLTIQEPATIDFIHQVLFGV